LLPLFAEVSRAKELIPTERAKQRARAPSCRFSRMESFVVRECVRMEAGITLELSDQKSRAFLGLIVLCDGFSNTLARCSVKCVKK
jgi:hypothetical protein